MMVMCMQIPDSIMMDIRRCHIQYNVPFYEILAFMILSTNADPEHLSIGKQKIYQDAISNINPIHNHLAQLHIGITGIRYSIARSVGYNGHPFDLMKPLYNIQAFSAYFSQIPRDSHPRDKLSHLDNAIPLYNITVEIFNNKLKEVLSMPLV